MENELIFRASFGFVFLPDDVYGFIRQEVEDVRRHEGIVLSFEGDISFPAGVLASPHFYTVGFLFGLDPAVGHFAAPVCGSPLQVGIIRYFHEAVFAFFLPFSEGELPGVLLSVQEEEQADTQCNRRE